MDATEASNALAEIQQRSEQTLHQGNPRKLPVWYTYGTAAALATVSASSDLTGWAETGLFLGAALTWIALTVALERTTGVRLRMRSLRWTPLVWLLITVLVTLIAVGTVLRLFDVPADGTLAGLAAAAVWAAALNRAQAAAVRKRA